MSLSDEGLREMSANRHEDQNMVLLSIGDNPRESSRDRARALGWLTKAGDPYHMRVVRAEKALEKARLITKDRDGWEVTDRGQKEIKRLKPSRPGQGEEAA
jgi:hypothetical protein